MELHVIGSDVDRRETRLDGIEIRAVAALMAEKFQRLTVADSGAGLIADFAKAFSSFGEVAKVAPRESEGAGRGTRFAGADAVLCYPGGLSTWASLFGLLSGTDRDGAEVSPPIYLYNWEEFYAPLLLQIETALVTGMIRPEAIAALRVFESVEELAQQLCGPDADGP